MQLGIQTKRISRRALWCPSEKTVGFSGMYRIHKESWSQNQSLRTWMCLFQWRSLPLVGNSLICRKYEVASMNFTNSGKDLLYWEWKTTSTLALAICHAKLWPRPWHLRAGEPLSVLSSWATFQINVPVWPLQVWFCPSWFIDPRWVMNESPQWQYFGAGVQIVHPWIFRVSLLHGKLEEEPYIIGKRVGMLFVDLHSLVFNRS